MDIPEYLERISFFSLGCNFFLEIHSYVFLFCADDNVET